MKVAIITVAGISSRFNEGIPEERKTLKSIYWEKDCKHSLLYHLLQKCSYADFIVIVGGYKFDALQEYCNSLENDLKKKILLVHNDHFSDLGSGYSLYLGLNAAFDAGADEILFVEGDLDIDKISFDKVVLARGNILTYNYQPIYTKKAVVLYKDIKDNYHYAFNSEHGCLRIEDTFSCILNSGQIWKFTEIQKLKRANQTFIKENKAGTNLNIIQNYLDDNNTRCELIGLKRWTNCNTREDFKQIMAYWEEEQ